MSIYISNLILPPDDRQDLVLCIQHDGTVLDPWGNLYNTRAIEVPPHGDLVDRGEIKNDWFVTTMGTVAVSIADIDGAKPIIPADPEEGE